MQEVDNATHMALYIVCTYILMSLGLSLLSHTFDLGVNERSRSDLPTKRESYNYAENC